MSSLYALDVGPAVLLIVSGVGKIRSPWIASSALKHLHIPGGSRVIRLLGGVEVVAALLVAARVTSYLAIGLFTLFALLAAANITSRRRLLPACGCFGVNQDPPGFRTLIVSVASTSLLVVGAAGSAHDLGLPLQIVVGGSVAAVFGAVLLAPRSALTRPRAYNRHSVQASLRKGRTV